MRAANLSIRTVAVVVVALVAPWAAAPGQEAGGKPDADPVYRALRQSPIGETFAVENLVLRRDAGVLTLKSGVVGFTAPTLGRDTEAVFVGDGEFTLTPSSSMEKTYMKSVADQDSVREAFDRVLLCFTDDTGREIRGQAKAHAADPRLADALRDFRNRLRSRRDDARSMTEDLLTSESMDNVDADILTDLYNPGHAGFFSAYVQGRKHPDLRFHVRPRGAIPALGTPEEVAVINLEPGENQDGVWYLSHLQAEIEKKTASSQEDTRTVQAEKYRIETSIAKNDHFTARTELELRAVSEGDRVIKLELLPSLRVTRVSAGGQAVPFVQEDRREDGSFYIVMPQAMPRGSAWKIAVEYEGDKVVHKAGGGSFSVAARTSWYPNVNTFSDHALYDLTFKVPKQYTLVSVGKLVRQWTENDLACTEWDSQVPMAVAGFNYGAFTKKAVTDPQSGFGIEGYAVSEVPEYLRQQPPGSMASLQRQDNTAMLMTPSRLIDQTLADAENAVRLYDSWFGASEFGRIAITQQPEFNFGQSWPTLVYLPLSAYLDATQRVALIGLQSGFTEFVEEVTPHEVSHQWWGHMVGWSTFHDQWLSEGFASFSAGLFLQNVEKNPKKYLDFWAGARERILEKNRFGRRANDAGPIWMGLRLESERNPAAYSRVVYDKGSYVLHMLRMMMLDPAQGDKPFIDMMHDFVRQHLNKNATTESFQRVVEQHMLPDMDLTHNGKMDWFFSEWVYGTTIPRYKFDYTVTPDAVGKFVLKCSLQQSEVTDDFVMQVPIYMDLDGKIVRLGSVRIAGNSTENLQTPLPVKPKRVLINYWHDVLEQ